MSRERISTMIELIGFTLIVTGIAVFSVPVAVIAAGGLLVLVGSLMS